MQGVNQPLIGISDKGDVKYMEPGKDYKFKGKKVKEYPVAQKGFFNHYVRIMKKERLLKILKNIQIILIVT